MKKIHLIGMGAGNPDHLTLEAITALQETDVFFFLEKEGRGKDMLLEARAGMLARHATTRPHRLVTLPSPPRERHPQDYATTVHDWRDQRTHLIGDALEQELKSHETGAFLVWGDPNLYDGMIDTLKDLISHRNMELDFRVIPGITCIQALTAHHKIPLNRVAETITITTGRLLEDVAPPTVTNAVVMLDSRRAYHRFKNTGHDIYWGAYLGTPLECLVSGPVEQVADQIDRTLEKGRAENGWIMDTYLLRKR